jgi:glycosyltransferase involved in cell wall biosynthesis
VNSVWLVIPGTLATKTGGYIYDRRIFAELESAGWQTATLSLDSSFPLPTETALREAKAGFDRIPDGQLVVIDGLALGGLTPLLPEIVSRLRPVALIHHPLADETGIDADSAGKLEAAEKAALALVARVIVTSRWTRRRLIDYAVDPSRVAVVSPGIDRGPLVDRAVDRAPESTVRLLSVATITERKGHAALIGSLARLKHLDWSLRCAGSLELDRRCAAALELQIEQAALGDRVALLGELTPDAVRDEYAKADLFVLPSYLEGYGMALAEAIAHRLPVVSTTAGAIPDTVPESASRLVPPGDVDALTEALRELIGDPGARLDLTLAACDAADRVSTWAAAGHEFAAVLTASLAR